MVTAYQKNLHEQNWRYISLHEECKTLSGKMDIKIKFYIFTYIEDIYVYKHMNEIKG